MPTTSGDLIPQQPIFEGPWAPSTGVFPIVPANIASAYYLVTGPGRVGGFDFAEGDWLLYLEEEGGAPNTGSWYRTSGGIIQLATTTQPISLVAADISDFAAATNAAILVDNVTIVKDPLTGVLTIIGGPGSVANIIEERDATYVPPHNHVSTDVTDFVSAVRAALGPTASNTPFFSNTLLTNAVVFSFNTTLNSITADVKIDNVTIVKNKYGQLVAGKPQPMNISDILGLTTYLNNYISVSANPLQTILGNSSSTGSWIPGAHDFTTVKVSDAFYLLNVDVANIENSLANLRTEVESSLGLAVTPPASLSSNILLAFGSDVAFFEAYRAGVGALQGTWDPTGAYPSGTFTTGDYFIISATHVVVSSFTAGDWLIWNGSSWADTLSEGQFQGVWTPTGSYPAGTFNVNDYFVISTTVFPFNAGDWLIWNGSAWMDIASRGQFQGTWTGSYPTGVFSVNDYFVISANFIITLTFTKGDWLVWNNAWADTPPVIIEATASDPLDTLPTASFLKGSVGLTSPGVLIAVIDGSPAGQIALNPSTGTTGYAQQGESNGALVITQDQDSFIAFPAFHDIFESIQAQIVSTGLLPGPHSYQLQENLSGGGSILSSILTFNVDIPAAPGTMSISSPSFNPSYLHVSGVPVLNSSLAYTLNFTAVDVVGFAYGKHIANVSGDSTTIDPSDGDVSANGLQAAPSPLYDVTPRYSNAIATSFVFHVLDTYNEAAALILTPYNSRGDLGSSPTILSLGRIDTTIETNRVYSGDPTQLYPSNAGATWNSSQSLVGVTYFGELQKINQNYQWPVSADYSSNGGPNYIGATGVVVASLPSSPTWRWVTLQLGTNVEGYVAFTLTFTGGNTPSWTSNPYTRKTSGILIYAELGASGWVDCNSPYSGVGPADTNGAPAMDVSGHGSYETTAFVKRVTLGPSLINYTSSGEPIPGNLLVRVALPFGSTMEFSDVVVSDWA